MSDINWKNPREWPDYIKGWRETSLENGPIGESLLLAAATQANPQAPPAIGSDLRNFLEEATGQQSLPAELRQWRVGSDADLELLWDGRPYGFSLWVSGYVGLEEAVRKRLRGLPKAQSVRLLLGHVYGDVAPDVWSPDGIQTEQPPPCAHPSGLRYVMAGGGQGCYSCDERIT